jgi:methionyl-tRNA formyltransferase
LQPENLKEEWKMVTDLHPTLIVTCAYGQLVPREILVYPAYGCINVHASLLPKLRGGAPIHRAIINGMKETGITIMHMNPRLDQGDIISQRAIPILDNDTASTLHDKLSVLGKDLLLETLPSIIDGTASRTVQDESEATFAFNIKPEDEKIDFSKLKKQIYNQVRGLNSWPGAYFMLDGKRIKVWECIMSDNNFSNLLDGQISGIYKEGLGIKVSNGEIILTVIQPEGKSKMPATDFINGHNDLIGKICG